MTLAELARAMHNFRSVKVRILYQVTISPACAASPVPFTHRSNQCTERPGALTSTCRMMRKHLVLLDLEKDSDEKVSDELAFHLAALSLWVNCVVARMALT